MIEEKDARKNKNPYALQPFDALMMSAMAEIGRVYNAFLDGSMYDSAVMNHMNRWIGSAATLCSVAMKAVGYGYGRGEWFHRVYGEERVELTGTMEEMCEFFGRLYFGFCYDLSVFRSGMTEERAEVLFRDMVALASLCIGEESLSRMMFCEEEP